MRLFSLCTALPVALMLAMSAEAKGGGKGSSGGSHSVRGHTTKDGTCVAPHRATNRTEAIGGRSGAAQLVQK